MTLGTLLISYNLTLIFFFPLTEFAPILASFAFCCHWRQKCWPFGAGDHIFHLILVYSDECGAVFHPSNCWKGWCTPPASHRCFTEQRLMLGWHYMNGFFFYQVHTFTSVIQLSCCCCLLATSNDKHQHGLCAPTSSASQVCARVFICVYASQCWLRRGCCLTCSSEWNEQLRCLS